MSTAADPSTTLLRLQSNSKGAWRDVLVFDAGRYLQIKRAAAELFGLIPGVSLRVTEYLDPQHRPPLAYWSRDDGWRLWEAHGHQA